MNERQKHALLPPSAAERWMRCPGSVRLSAGITERPSPYAQEGIDAHNAAAICLAHGRNSGDPDIQSYVEFIREQSEGKKLLVEQRVSLEPWVPGGFGTADAVIISEDRLQVIDLKFGKGVLVYAPENPQLRLYALGAYGELDLCYRFEAIEAIIFQPRRDHVSREVLSPDELLTFGGIIRDAAERALKKDAPAIPGEIQ